MIVLWLALALYLAGAGVAYALLRSWWITLAWPLIGIALLIAALAGFDEDGWA